jgi:hypothetical protein
MVEWTLRRRERREAGNALVSVMLFTAALLPLGAFAALQAQLDLVIEHRTRAATEAFEVAESGLAHALADLAAAPEFERLERGPDGVRGTGDDAEYPFAAPPPQFFPRPPMHYDVEVEALDSDVVEIVSHGTGNYLAARTVAASVVRSSTPYVPAALSVGASEVSIDLGDAVVLDGVDAQTPDEDPVAGVALDDDYDVDVFLSQLPLATRQRLRGAGGSPSAVRHSFSSAANLAQLLAALPDAEELIGQPIQGPFGNGVRVVRGSTEVRDAEGSGILVVDGDLQISGNFAFAGILLVAGDLHSEPDSSLDIAGAVVLGASTRTVELLGQGTIGYASAALQSADALAPGLLPHRAVPVAWRERF